MFKNFIMMGFMLAGINNIAFETIGYCGACGYAPENTILSFETAINMGVSAIELDVHVCKSGQVVVTHDNDIARTTGNVGLVSQMNLDDLKKLDLGQGQAILTLMEALDFINRRVKVVIDLKGGSATTTAKIVRDYLENKGWTRDDLIICSDIPEELVNFQSILPDLSVAAIFCRLDLKDGLKKFARVNFDIIQMRMYKINKKTVQAVHSMGKKINVSCKNEKNEEYGDIQDFRLMRALGVDGIQSAYPDLVIRSQR